MCTRPSGGGRVGAEAGGAGDDADHHGVGTGQPLAGCSLHGCDMVFRAIRPDRSPWPAPSGSAC